MVSSLFCSIISINISFIHTIELQTQPIYQIITTIKLTLSHLTTTTITTPPTPPNTPTTTIKMSGVYLPSMTFSAPNSAPSSRAASIISPKSPRRSTAEDYWTSPSANFGFQSAVATPAASRAPSVKAAKPAGEKKSLKSRVKSVLSRGTEEYWAGAAQNAKFGVVSPPVAQRI
jgi:hypothetical protein